MPLAVVADGSEEDDYIIPASSARLAPASSSSAPNSPTGSGLPPTETPTITLLRAAREGSTELRPVPLAAPAAEQNVYQQQQQQQQQHQMFRDYPTSSSLPSSPSPLPEVSPIGWTKTYNQRVVTRHGPTPKVHGVGPTENGVPITPRGNVDDEHGSDWYRTMYKRLHTYKKPQADQEVITVRVKRGLSHYRDDGYVSEPEHTPAERRRFSEKRWPYEHHQQHGQTLQQQSEAPSNADASGTTNGYRAYSGYRVTPKKIEDYQPGESSVSTVDSAVQRDKMYHQHKYNPPVPTPPKPAYVFSDDDSFKMVKLAQDLPTVTTSSNNNSPSVQRDWYRNVQKGHDIPLGGLRRPQPTPPKEPRVGPCPAVQSGSPYGVDFSDTYKFLESQNMALERDYEDLKAMRQRKEQELNQFREEAEIKKRIQEEVDQEMRRHHDTLLPGEKSPLPGNRYDGSLYETVFFTPENKQVIMLGRVIYDFVAHTPRELNMKKGDLVYIFKKIDRNWYEGECLGRTGIFPVRYVDAFPPSSLDSLTGVRIQEGSAIGRFNFPAKNATELSFKVGDKLQLLRRIDHNWFEAKLGTRRGLAPENYLTVLAEPLETRQRD